MEELKPQLVILKNGPIMVDGQMNIVQSDGIVVETKKCFLCRCGESKIKPYCDGTHKKIDFKD